MTPPSSEIGISDATLFPTYRAAAPLSAGRFWASLLFLVALCGLFAALQWLRFDSFWGDTGRWLFECRRAAQGELPYRDFTWQYPPLGLWVMAGAFRLFEPTFLTAQIVITLFGIAVILLTWHLARRFLPENCALSAATLLACMLGPTKTYWSLFSLNLYTPSVTVCLAALLLFLIGLVAYVQDGRYSAGKLACLGMGAAGCFLGKPEGAIAVLASLLLTALADRGLHFANRSRAEWLRFWSGLGVLTILPPLLIYIALGAVVGFRQLKEGVTAYDATAGICPWWPTGLGVSTMIIDLGLGLFILALLSLGFTGRLLKLTPPARVHYLLLWILGLVALGANLGLTIKNSGFSAGTLYDIAFTSTNWIGPARWFALLLTLYIALRTLRDFRHGQSLTPAPVALLAVAVSILVIHVRSLFSSHLEQHPTVAVMALPLIIIFGGYLLLRGLEYIRLQTREETAAPAVDAHRASVLLTTNTLLYAALIAATAANVLLKRQYIHFVTLAGPVSVLANGPELAVYDYVLAHTRPTDGVLDTGYGGGINFAARRPGVVGMTQFTAFRPSDALLQSDLARFLTHPPPVVVANDPIEFRTAYGINRPVACPCPRLVWKPTANASVPGKKFPVLEYVKSHYKIAAHIQGSSNSSGSKLVYEP